MRKFPDATIRKVIVRTPNPPPFPLSALTLGTVQLGMSYGVANPGGPPDERAARAVLDAARAGGVRIFDTARAYGAAESRIGDWLRTGGPCPALVSKFPALDRSSDAAGTLRAHFEASCTALGVERLDGYLAHRAADIAMPGVGRVLRDLVAADRLGAFGVSAYDAAGLEAALAVEGLRLAQVPASVLDTRLMAGGWLQRCGDAGLVVFARSAFLQGALLMPTSRLPGHLTSLVPRLREFHAIAARTGRTPVTLALGFLRAVPAIDSIVVGAYDPAQLSACLEAAVAPPLDPTTLDELRALSEGLDGALIDPSRWPPPAAS